MYNWRNWKFRGFQFFLFLFLSPSRGVQYMFSTLERSLIFEKKKKNRKRDGACLCRVENALCDVLSIWERERESRNQHLKIFLSLLGRQEEEEEEEEERETLSWASRRRFVTWNSLTQLSLSLSLLTASHTRALSSLSGELSSTWTRKPPERSEVPFSLSLSRRNQLDLKKLILEDFFFLLLLLKLLVWEQKESLTPVAQCSSFSRVVRLRVPKWPGQPRLLEREAGGVLSKVLFPNIE